MSNLATKPMMKQFQPNVGWTDIANVASVVPINNFSRSEKKLSTKPIQPDALANLGNSIQDIFSSLQIVDPTRGSWNQVDIAMKEVGAKLQEKKQLESRLNELKTEIELASHQAAELVAAAHQKEIEIHSMSKMRLDIAELLNNKLVNALKS